MIPKDFKIENTYEEALVLMVLRRWYEQRIELDKIQPNLSKRLEELDDLINRSS